MKFYFIERPVGNTRGGTVHRFAFPSREEFLQWLDRARTGYRNYTYTEVPLSCVKKITPELIDSGRSHCPWPR